MPQTSEDDNWVELKSPSPTWSGRKAYLLGVDDRNETALVAVETMELAVNPSPRVLKVWMPMAAVWRKGKSLLQEKAEILKKGVEITGF